MLFLVPADPPGERPPEKNLSVKVELDIEDAPFIVDPEEPAPRAKAKAQAQAPQAMPEQPAPSGFKHRLAALFANKTRLALVGCAVLLVLLAPVALNMFLHKTSAPPPPDPVRKLMPDEPPRQDTPAGHKFLFKGDAYFIERRGDEGELRFLRCRFSIPTDNPALFAELQAKNIAVRDAVYYYLNNKPVTFLSDNTNTKVLKMELISVINEHISADKIQDLYIEEYLVTHL
jgi:flagellar FliL protein